ncbi:FG-GAP repeat domain-containing protein [Actinokineospora sp. HUAS TT18]|uniref:FG-GAP repeat domain-containing protein n=1 Tax=Actinokineospora sp. HUAS TT18 TaxID=3447451 RepID=UPI003F51F31A
MRSGYRSLALMLGAVTAGGLLPVVSVPAAAEATPNSVIEAVAGENTALATAKKQGKRVEVLDKRTETGQVFANPDGKLTAELAPLPVRVKQGGRWVGVDTTLASTSDGRVAPKAASSRISFSGGGDGAMATMVRDGKEFTLTWPTALPKPALKGPDATYPDVFPGTDLVLHASPTGFSHLLVVKNAEAAKNPALAKVKLGLSTPGLTTTADAGGIVTASDKGTPVFVTGAPSMWDTPAGKPVTEPAADARQAKVGVKVDGGSLELTPDQKLLGDPAARFPLVIDPSYVERPKWDWNLFESQHKDTNYWTVQGNVHKVGHDGLREWRSIFRFDMSVVNGGTVISSKLKVGVSAYNSCPDTSAMNIHISSQLPQYATWNNSGWGGWMSSAFGCGDANGLYFPSNDTFKAKVQESATAGWGGIVFGINTATPGIYKELTPGSTLLVIEYNHTPNVPSNVAMAPTKPCGYGADRAFVTTATPQFSATLSDPNGDNVGGRLEIVRKSDNAVVYANPAAGTNPALSVASGNSLTWAPVPAGALATGVAYTYRVSTFDGLAWSAPAYGCEFEVDLGAAGTPGLSTQCDPPVCDPEFGMPVGTARAVTITPAPGDTTVAKYKYGTQQGQFTMTVAAGPDGTATIPFTQWVTDPRSLFVKAVSRAGLDSPGTASIDISARTGPASAPGTEGDANGDGVADIAAGYSDGATQNSVYTWHNTPSGAYQPVGIEVNSGYANTAVQTVRGDFDGDKLTDIAMIRQEAGDRVTVWIYRAEGTRYIPPTTAALDTAGHAGWYLANIKPLAGDFDGDGKADLAFFYQYGNCQTKVWTFYGTSTGLTGGFTQPSWDSTVGQFCWDRIKPVVGDFDNAADNRDEIGLFYRWDNACDWSVDIFRVPGARGVVTKNATGVKDAGCSDWYKVKAVAGDFDGDGRDDMGNLYNYGNGQAKLWTLASNGNITGATFGTETQRWDSGVGGLDWNKVEAMSAAQFDAGAEEVLVVEKGTPSTNLWTLKDSGSGYTKSLRWDGRVTAGAGTIGKGASLTGDFRAETVRVKSDGSLWGAPNVDGAHGAFGVERYSAGTSTDPARAFFADLDGDGKKEFIYLKPDGVLRGYPNIDGLNDGYGTGRKVGEGFPDPARLRFADLDGDGRDDLIRVEADGTVQAWPNVEGINNIWGSQRQVASGFTDAARVRFADLDADGRDDLVQVESGGQARGWVNTGGLSGGWATSKVIALGLPDHTRAFFADLDGDGRADLVRVESSGELRLWTNVNGADGFWGADRIVSTGWTDPARLKFA